MSIVLFIVAVVLIFHLAWFTLTYFKTQKEPPEDEVIASVQAYYDDILHLKAVRDLLEEEYIETRTQRLHLDILANGKGLPTVVFIPGTSAYAQSYMALMHAISENGFNVIGFDPRGHGRSSGPRGDYAINEIATDALDVVAYARRRFNGPVVVAGSSQGGIAAFYAAAMDDSLAGAVCHNLADLNGRENQVLSKLRVPYWLTPAAQILMRIYQGFAIPISLYLDLKKEFFDDGTSVDSYIHKDPLCVTWITFRALNSLLKTPLAQPVEEIKVPIMVVHADKDNIFPQAYVEDIYQRLKCRKKFLLLKDRGHLVMTNRLEQVIPAITAWLHDVTRLSP